MPLRGGEQRLVCENTVHNLWGSLGAELLGAGPAVYVCRVHVEKREDCDADL